MTFKEAYKDLCAKGIITDTTINEDSFKTLAEAIDAKIITDVAEAEKLLKADAAPAQEDSKKSAPADKKPAKETKPVEETPAPTPVEETKAEPAAIVVDDTAEPVKPVSKAKSTKTK